MPDDPLCKICFSPMSTCICPECPTCGGKGQKKCYVDHVLKLTRDQVILRTEKLIERIGEELDVEKNYLVHLNEQPESYCEEWSKV